jgi:hypothetical protein
VDGVVAAYPQGGKDIQKALTFLNDDYIVPGGCWTVFPDATASAPGDFTSLSQMARVTNGNVATIRFHYWNDYGGPTKGYHVMQVRVDNQVVWSEDVAGPSDKTVLLNLKQFVGVKPTVKISLGVWDLKGVSEFAVRVAFSDLHVTGLEMHDSDLGDEPGWQIATQGAFHMECHPARIGQHKFRLPLIVMPAGEREEYVHRYKDAATPEHIAARTREALELGRQGKLEGVVIYCLDKTAGNPDFAAIAKLYEEFGK